MVNGVHQDGMIRCRQLNSSQRIPELKMEEQPEAGNDRSIVLLDWARHNEPTGSTSKYLIYVLMLLSLRYDEVLVPDEICVAGHKMTRWFGRSVNFRLLEELFDACGLVVRKRPLRRYPTDLQEMASSKPISARREHLRRFAVTNDGDPIEFTDSQVKFHKKFEAFLVGSDNRHREAGARSSGQRDIMDAFGHLLGTVLTDARYHKWREKRFHAI